MILYLIIAVFMVILLYIFITFNDLIKTRNLVREAFSTMDVYLKRRWDLIPNLVEVVKAYAKHEKETLENVILARSTSYNSMSSQQKINSNNELANDISKILIISERYPDLKADNNFIQLSQELSQIETDIANSRKYYNGTVKVFNNKVQMFPSNLIACLFGFKSENMFSIGTEEKENVKVDLKNEN